tara:strand:- start:12684 stop:13667 length:984 start_codon:yes stop_codon:yes gene_type:complete
MRISGHIEKLFQRISLRFQLSFKVLLAPLIRVFETLYLRPSSSSRRGDIDPVFIIGAPRTGSTILYQALTNLYDVQYVDNVACSWCRNLRFGMWLSTKKYGDAPHNNFNADYGGTERFGGHAPSECGEFWYRWLPTDRHFLDHQDVTARMRHGIKTELRGIANFSRKPLILKNLNAGQRLRLLKQVCPGARFIFVRRDPRFVTQSIIAARKKFGVREHEWWSIKPPNVSDLVSLPELEMCVAQVYFLERQIEKDLKLFPNENVREVHYQELDEKKIWELGRWIGAVSRPESKLPVFHKDKLEKLSTQNLEQLDELVNKYPFKKELFV